MLPKMKFSRLRACTIRIAVGVAIASYTTMTIADELLVAGTRYQQVTIDAFESTQIAFTTPGGEFKYADLADLEYLQVDSLTNLRDLNSAENHVRNGDPRRAIPLYERALRLAGGYWPPLIRTRIIRAAHDAGDLNTLATHFVQLTKDSQHGAVRAAAVLSREDFPTNTGHPIKAIRILNAAIDGAVSQSSRVLNEALRFNIAIATNNDQSVSYAKSLANQPLTPDIATRSVYHAIAGALSVLASAGQRDDAIRILDDAFVAAPKELLPELLIARAKITLDGAVSDADALRAASSAMRIVAHYPNDPLVPEALAITAQAHERIGRTPTAIQLWEECSKHASAATHLVDLARSELSRLRSNS